MSETAEKTVKETTKEVTVQKNASKKAEPKTVVYAGPTIPGVVSTGTIYNNGLSAALQEAVKEEAAVGTMLVEVDKLAKTRAAIGRKDTPEAICYTKIEEYARKKGE